MKIVNITDSIGWTGTSGYWPWVQEDLIQVSGVRVIDNVQNSRNYDNSTNQLAVLPAAITSLGITAGDVVVVNCGLHDIENNAGVCDVSKTLYASNLTAIFALLNAAVGVTGKIFWCTTTSVDETYTTSLDPKRFNFDIIAYNAIATPLAIAAGATIVDLYTAGLGTNKYPDGTHHDVAGREVLARAVCAAIRNYLGSTESYAAFVKYLNSTKKYKIKLPQANIHLSTENTPLIINETGLSSLFENAAFSDGRDIVATSGATKLPIAKSVFDVTNKKLSFAIGISKRSLIRDDQLYLQCGDAAINEASDTTVFVKKDVLDKLCDIESTMRGYFPMLGDLLDKSANVDNGNITTGVTPATNGRGYVFDGASGSMITLTKMTSYQNLTAFCIEVVFTPTDISASSGLQGLFTKCHSNGGRGFFLSLYNARIHFGGFDAAQGVFPDIYSAVGSLVNGVRYVASVTYDGTNVNLYLNGCLVGTSVSTVDIVQFLTAIIGRQYYDYGPYYFAGTIHQVRTWNVNKTAAQVAQLANHELTYHAGKWLGHYPMLNLNDYSGNANTMTASGATLNASKKGYDFVSASKQIMTTANTTLYQNLSGLTLWAIVTPSAIPASYGGIISKYHTASRGFALALYTDGKVMARITDEVQAVHDLFSAAGSIVVGTKYMIALTHDGAIMKLILNGILIDSYAGVFDSAQANAIVLGRLLTDYDGYYMDGTIHDWGAINYAMNEAELKTMWDEQAAISQVESNIMVLSRIRLKMSASLIKKISIQLRSQRSLIPH